jgi:N-methylhydantoinase A
VGVAAETIAHLNDHWSPDVYSLDIDIGGTFTDGFFTDGIVVEIAKAPTTPHDVTEGFLDCVKLGSDRFGLSLEEFLRRTSVARLSTTIGTNLLVQHKGARVGLLVTAGSEAALYGPEPTSAHGGVIASDMVLGITEAVDGHGGVAIPPDEQEVLAKVRTLVHKGAEIIVVSLRNAWRNPANEYAVRTMIRNRYPIHYLRSVPVQLGVEIVLDRDDHARTNSALLNAYIHAEMARVLFRAEDKLRAAGYPRPLLIVHSSGGNARVTKTVALNTLHSGPAVAVKGAAELSRWLGLSDVVSADMGGTSFDIGVVLDQTVSLERAPKIDGIRIATPIIELASIALGGGSIAYVENDEIMVGPESAGSAPGPACYGKGGTEPTITDADLLLGFIDAGNFLGGRMKLDIEAAARAIERRLGRKLQLTVEQAAFLVRQAGDETMARALAASLEDADRNPANVSLFSVGGAGPLHACRIAELVGLRQVIAFPFGSVFSAFGSSTTDVQHLYRHIFGVPVPSSAPELGAAIEDIVRQASLDMRGEGFAAADVFLSFEADFGSGRMLKVEGRASQDTKELWRQLNSEAKEAAVDTLHVSATSATPHWRQSDRRGAPQAATSCRTRDVWWDSAGPTRTPVYERAPLAPGFFVNGPAIVEAADTTYAVCPGWTLAVNNLAFYIMTRN